MKTANKARRLRFAAEYLVDLNCLQAAIRAGFSESWSKRASYTLLSDPDVQAAIAEGQKRIADKLEVTAERVKRELALIAFSDVRKLFTAEGHLRRIAELSPEEAASLASVEFHTERPREGPVEHVAKVKTWDKTRALELLARHFGMLKDSIEVKLADVFSDDALKGIPDDELAILQRFFARLGGDRR